MKKGFGKAMYWPNLIFLAGTSSVQYKQVFLHEAGHALGKELPYEEIKEIYKLFENRFSSEDCSKILNSLRFRLKAKAEYSSPTEFWGEVFPDLFTIFYLDDMAFDPLLTNIAFGWDDFLSSKSAKEAFKTQESELYKLMEKLLTGHTD